MGTRWGWGKGKGEEREGGQYTANQGSEWTGIHATTQKRGVQGIRVLGIPKQKGIIERIGACTSVFQANHVCEMQDTCV